VRLVERRHRLRQFYVYLSPESSLRDLFQAILSARSRRHAVL
jgi:hypothetical protein